MRILDSSCLLLEPWQSCSVLCREEIATPGEQATDAHRILGDFVASTGAVDELKPLMIQPHSPSDRIMEEFERRLF